MASRMMQGIPSLGLSAKRTWWGRLVLLSLTGFWAITAVGADAGCTEPRTEIYSTGDVSLDICHRPNVSFDRSRMQEWQSCTDEQIRMTDKRRKQTRVVVDCDPFAPKEFAIRGNVLEVRHKITVYPGLKFEPAVLESFDPVKKTRKFTFLRDFPACPKKEVHNAANEVTSVIGKSPGGEAYLATVYGGLFRLRDCARSRPESVLPILQAYQRNQVFDGEVSETLGHIIGEVQLLSAAAKTPAAQRGKQAR